MAKSVSKSKKPTATDKSSISALTRRVVKLEAHLSTFSVSASGISSARTAGPNIVSTDPTLDARPLTFQLAAGGPTIVKLTLDGSEVLMLGTGPSSSIPRTKGSVTSLLIDLHGTSGQQASITITNAIPAGITATIPPGRSDWSEPRSLLAKW